MHLYHTNHCSIDGSKISIFDSRIVYQLKRVMRSRKNDHITLQVPGDQVTHRYECVLLSISDVVIEAEIITTASYVHDHRILHLVVAMSNKWDKMELIFQKAIECGVSQITVVPMCRSVIRQRNDHKWSRLEAIAIEATEQSWGYRIPLLRWCDSLDGLDISGQLLLAHMSGELLSSLSYDGDVTLIIGPEGGIDDRDISLLNQQGLDYKVVSLGSTVLRMETAAIVGSWYLSQNN